MVGIVLLAFGLVRLEWFGTARRGWSSQGFARSGLAGEVWLVWERFCADRSCMVWFCRHGSVRLVESRREKVRYGIAGKASRVRDWLVTVGYGRL